MAIVVNKIEDKYYLINTENTALTYTITFSDGCNSSEQVSSGEFLNIETPQFIPFNSKDGLYGLVINNPETSLTITLSYKIYNNMLTSIIYAVEDMLCDCDSCCKGGCSEHQTKCDKMQSLLNRILFYKFLTDSDYNLLLEENMQDNMCLFSDELMCDTNSELIKGSINNNDKLTKMLIAFHYVSLMQYNYNDERPYIETKFRYKKINACIRDLGIVINNSGR